MLRENHQTSKSKTQTQVVGGKDISKMAQAPSSGWLEILYLEKHNKQARRTEADVAVSCSRLQSIMSAQMWTKAIHSF
jgi:hypothetical protein